MIARNKTGSWIPDRFRRIQFCRKKTCRSYENKKNYIRHIEKGDRCRLIFPLHLDVYEWCRMSKITVAMSGESIVFTEECFSLNYPTHFMIHFEQVFFRAAIGDVRRCETSSYCYRLNVAVVAALVASYFNRFIRCVVMLC